MDFAFAAAGSFDNRGAGCDSSRARETWLRVISGPVVEEETAWTAPVAGAGEFQILEMPTDRKAQRIVEFGAFAVG